MNTALIQFRGLDPSAEAAVAAFVSEYELDVLGIYGNGQVVRGDLPLLRTIQDAVPERFLVLIYENVDVCRVNGYDITPMSAGTGAAISPFLPPAFVVPEAEWDTWPDYLLQFAVPPRPEWLHAFQLAGFEVVETIGPCGLHLRRTRDANMDAHELAEVLRFRVWGIPFHPAFRVDAALQAAAARGAPDVALRYVAITVAPARETSRVITLLQQPVQEDAGSEQSPGGPAASAVSAGVVVSRSDTSGRLIVELAASAIARIARDPAVRWMQMVSRNVRHDGEFETQILAGNLRQNPTPPETPFPGYASWLSCLGLSGDGVIVAICDSGVDVNADNNSAGHLDLRGRQAAFIDYTSGRVKADTHGHGTHMAGIILGNAATGTLEATAYGGFLLGQGVAPQARYVTLNATAFAPNAADTTWWPPADFSALSRDALDWGARVMNCSWSTDPTGTTSGYTTYTRQVDELVRDPTGDGAPLDGLISVWSAGNVAKPTAASITEPKEAKNPIVVGNSLNLREHTFTGDDPYDPAGISGTSAHGPASDGRFLPTIVAPGMDVPSALAAHATDPLLVQSVLAADGTRIIDIADPHTRPYALLSGTSTAAAHVSGVCALLTEWWDRTRGTTGMSPALAKALLVNSAVDLVGGPDGTAALEHIPDNHQGWGRVSIENLFLQRPADGTPPGQSALPSSDRGTRLLFDRQVLAPNPSEPPKILQHERLVAPCATNLPLRITLAWTDAPGALGTSPALVNNLNLEIYEEDTGVTYRGNDFHNGWSSPHPTRSFDALNNVECVYIREPRGLYRVRVIAATLGADARPPYSPFQPWQDYSLVLDNAREATRTPIRTVALIDRSTSMRVLGTFAPVRLAAAHFVQILRPTDRISVMDFNGASEVAYGASGAGARVDGPQVPDAASACIDALNTTGTTALGDALTAAIELARAPTSAALQEPPVVVLWSDGHENDGARTAVEALTADLVATLGDPTRRPVRVHTMALFPAANQALLSAIASRTGGIYGYAPNEAALHQLNNTILAHHTGDALVVNETVLVSTFANRPTSVGVNVSSEDPRVTITVAWSDTTVVYAPGTPVTREDLDILLVDPTGRRVPANASEIRRHVRPGLVLFEVPEPRAGRWVVVLRTIGTPALRCTVGGLVPSKRVLTLSTTCLLRDPENPSAAPTPTPLTGCDVTVNVEVKSEGQSLTGLQVEARLQTPFSLRAITLKHRQHFDALSTHPIQGDDALPQQLAGWAHARQDILDAEGIDLFEPLEVPIVLKPSQMNTDGVRTWSGTFPSTLLPGTYTFLVNARGWDPEAAESWTRSGRISVHIGQNPELAPTTRPPMADPAGIPEPVPRSLVTLSPGEEIDIDETGLTGSSIETTTQNQDPINITNGAGRWIINRTGGGVIGDLTSIGGGISPYVIKVPPPPVGTITKVNSFNLATDNWRFTATPWPDSFEITLSPTAVRPVVGETWESYTTAGVFPGDNSGDVVLGSERAWRITKLLAGSTVVTIGFLRRTVTVVGNISTITQTWYADPTFLVNKPWGTKTVRVLRSTTNVPWRFASTTPTQQEAARTYVGLVLVTTTP